jgi:hypothetical protein
MQSADDGNTAAAHMIGSLTSHPADLDEDLHDDLSDIRNRRPGRAEDEHTIAHPLDRGEIVPADRAVVTRRSLSEFCRRRCAGAGS